MPPSLPLSLSLRSIQDPPVSSRKKLTKKNKRHTETAVAKTSSLAHVRSQRRSRSLSRDIRCSFSRSRSNDSILSRCDPHPPANDVDRRKVLRVLDLYHEVYEQRALQIRDNPDFVDSSQDKCSRGRTQLMKETTVFVTDDKNSSDHYMRSNFQTLPIDPPIKRDLDLPSKDSRSKNLYGEAPEAHHESSHRRSVFYDYSNQIIPDVFSVEGNDNDYSPVDDTTSPCSTITISLSDRFQNLTRYSELIRLPFEEETIQLRPSHSVKHSTINDGGVHKISRKPPPPPPPRAPQCEGCKMQQAVVSRASNKGGGMDLVSSSCCRKARLTEFVKDDSDSNHDITRTNHQVLASSDAQLDGDALDKYSILWHGDFLEGKSSYIIRTGGKRGDGVRSYNSTRNYVSRRDPTTSSLERSNTGGCTSSSGMDWANKSKRLNEDETGKFSFNSSNEKLTRDRISGKHFTATEEGICANKDLEYFRSKSDGYTLPAQSPKNCTRRGSSEPNLSNGYKTDSKPRLMCSKLKPDVLVDHTQYLRRTLDKKCLPPPPRDLLLSHCPVKKNTLLLQRAKQSREVRYIRNRAD